MDSPPNRTAASPGLRALLREKIHLARGALAGSPGHVQERLASGWDGALALAHLLTKLPDAGLAWWAQQPRGHILLTAQAQAYATGELLHGQDTLEAVARVPLPLLVTRPAEALALALQPLDHLLGCHGQADGPWLSDGGGITPRWRRVGEQVARLFPLGYGLSPQARTDPHAYLAQGLALALLDPRRLQTEDPKLHRLLRDSLLNAGFWRHFVQEWTQEEGG